MHPLQLPGFRAALAVFSARFQTDGTDDMKLMSCSSIKVPSRMMSSGWNGGAMNRSQPFSHGIKAVADQAVTKMRG